MSVYGGPADWWTDGTDAGRKHIATKGIVQSGLVLNLDAGVSDSYPGSGTTWTDLSGNGITGTLVNGVGYNSGNGGSLVFDGANDFVIITLPTTSSYNTFTYSAWIYATASNGYRTIIDQDNDDWLFAIFNGQLISYDPNVSSGYIINLNQWYNVVMSHVDGGPVLFYVNGVLVHTSANNATTHTTSYFGIGAGITSPTLGDEFWLGNISQVAIYNRALTAQEIRQNFNATRNRFGI